MTDPMELDPKGLEKALEAAHENPDWRKSYRPEAIKLREADMDRAISAYLAATRTSEAAEPVAMSHDVREIVARLKLVEGERYRRLALDAAAMIEYLAARREKR